MKYDKYAEFKSMPPCTITQDGKYKCWIWTREDGPHWAYVRVKDGKWVSVDPILNKDGKPSRTWSPNEGDEA